MISELGSFGLFLITVLAFIFCSMHFKVFFKEYRLGVCETVLFFLTLAAAGTEWAQLVLISGIGLNFVLWFNKSFKEKKTMLEARKQKVDFCDQLTSPHDTKVADYEIMEDIIRNIKIHLKNFQKAVPVAVSAIIFMISLFIGKELASIVLLVLIPFNIIMAVIKIKKES